MVEPSWMKFVPLWKKLHKTPLPFCHVMIRWGDKTVCALESWLSPDTRLDFIVLFMFVWNYDLIFQQWVIIFYYYNLLCWSSCPRFWYPLQAYACVLCTCLSHSLSISLLSGTTEYSRVTLYFPYPSHSINHLSKVGFCSSLSGHSVDLIFIHM